MPYRGTPVVRDNLLLRQGVPSLMVGTPAWFAWLEEVDCFCYLSSHSSYRLTIRKEKRRNSFYWYAYLKVDRKLHNAYLGQARALTEEKLAWALRHLLVKCTPQKTASEKKEMPA